MPEQEKTVKSILLLTIIGAAFSVIYGFVRFKFGYPPHDRLAGTFASPVSFGNIIALINLLGVSYILFKLYRNRYEAALVFAANIIIFFGLIFTATRGGIIAFLAGAVFIIVYVLRLKGVFLTIIILSTLALCVYMAPGLNKKFMETIFMFSSPDTSLGWRFVLWKAAFEVFKENPIFGVGFNNLHKIYLELFPIHNGSIAHAHSNFLQILAEHGLLGAFAITALMVRLFISYVSGFLKHNAKSVIGLGLYIVFFLKGISEYSFFDSEVCMLFWFVNGMFLGDIERNASSISK
jgi:O-antigen ligase